MSKLSGEAWSYYNQNFGIDTGQDEQTRGKLFEQTYQRGGMSMTLSVAEYVENIETIAQMHEKE